MSNSLLLSGLLPTRLLCSWNFQGKNTGVGCHVLLQGIFPTQGSNMGLLHHRQILYRLSCQRSPQFSSAQSLSNVRLFATPWTVAHQAPLSMGFPRQEYWSGLPFPFPGDLSDPGIKATSSALAVGSLPLSHEGSPTEVLESFKNFIKNVYLFIRKKL